MQLSKLFFQTLGISNSRQGLGKLRKGVFSRGRELKFWGKDKNYYPPIDRNVKLLPDGG